MSEDVGVAQHRNGEPAAAAIGAQPKSAIEKQLGLGEAEPSTAEPSSNGSGD